MDALFTVRLMAETGKRVTTAVSPAMSRDTVNKKREIHSCSAHIFPSIFLLLSLFSQAQQLLIIVKARSLGPY